MSLIPSESHSFPDNYSPVARSRRHQERNVSSSRLPAKPVEKSATPPVVEKEPKMVPPPASKTVEANFFPSPEKVVQRVVTPMPAKAMERSFAPPIKMVPRRVRPVAPPPSSSVTAQDILMQIANGHGRAAQNRPKTPMRGLKPLPVSRAPVVENKIDSVIAETGMMSSAPPEEVEEQRAEPIDPLLGAPAIDQTFEEFNFDDSPVGHLRKRRRSRLFRFLVFELFAIGVLVPSAWLVLSGAITDPTLLTLMNILAIGLAAGAVIVPIILFAVAPALPRER